MKLIDGVVIRKLSDHYMLVAVGKATKKFNGVITLNETGAFLCKMLVKGATRQELIDALTNTYEVSADVASEDVDILITQLKEANLVE